MPSDPKDLKVNENGDSFTSINWASSYPYSTVKVSKNKTSPYPASWFQENIQTSNHPPADSAAALVATCEFATYADKAKAYASEPINSTAFSEPIHEAITNWFQAIGQPSTPIKIYYNSFGDLEFEFTLPNTVELDLFLMLPDFLPSQYLLAKGILRTHHNKLTTRLLFPHTPQLPKLDHPSVWELVTHANTPYKHTLVRKPNPHSSKSDYVFTGESATGPFF